MEQVLKRNSIGYVHLNGSVPSKQRKGLMSRFREDPECKVFLSTDAGGVGLNLQSGSVVINMDIPWNPAVLEQRIGRVHRLGQHKNVRAINFITKSSIEERILELLKFKKSLFAGALDKDGKDIVMVGESQLKKFMQSVETMTENLEKPDPELERQQQRESEQAAKAVDMEEITTVKCAESTTECNGNGLDTLNNLLISGAQFLTNLSKTLSKPEHQAEKYLDIRIDRDTQTGKAYLKIPLPETEVMNNIFSALGKFLSNTIHKNNNG